MLLHLPVSYKLCGYIPPHVDLCVHPGVATKYLAVRSQLPAPSSTGPDAIGHLYEGREARLLFAYHGSHSFLLLQPMCMIALTARQRQYGNTEVILQFKPQRCTSELMHVFRHR